jgi:hypothetical protein
MPKKCWMAVGYQNNDSLPKFGFLVDILECSGHLVFVFRVHATTRYNGRYGEFEICPDESTVMCFYAMALRFRYVFNVINIGRLQLIKSKYNILQHC